MSLAFSFSDDRVLSSPSLRVGDDEADHGYLWPNDGQDHEGDDFDASLSSPAGTEVVYEAELTPDCDEPDFDPIISLTVSTEDAGGDEVVETFEPENADVFADALTLACGAGLAAQAGGGSIGDGGEARVAFMLGNPDDTPVSVTVPALTQNGVAWQADTFTVPGASFTMVVLQGSGVECGTHQGVPWTTDRLLIDGQHNAIPLTQSWDC